MNVARKQLLSEHHRDLDARLDRLVVRAQVAPPAELRAAWTAFERELLRHLDLEETEIVPAFARHDPAEAHALLAEHAEIRSAVLDLGVNLDLHSLRAEAVEDLVRRLKRHAAREDAALYPWAARQVPPSAWQRVKRGLGAAASTGRRLARLADRTL